MIYNEKKCYLIQKSSFLIGNFYLIGNSEILK